MAATNQPQAAYGWATAMGINKEVTYGVAVAANFFVSVVDDAMIYTNKILPRMGTRKTKGSTLGSLGLLECKGSFEVECQPEEIGRLLSLGYGFETVTATAGVSGGWTHAIKAGSPLDTITISADYGKNSVHQWTGCKIDSIDITAKAGSITTAKFAVIGANDIILPTTSLSPTFGSLQPYDFGMTTTATINGTQFPFDSMSISTKNSLLSYYGAGYGRVIRNINEKNAVTTGTLSVSYESDFIQNLVIAGTPSNIVFTFTHPVSGYALTIAMPNCILEEAALAPKRNDVVMQNVKFSCYESVNQAQDDVNFIVEDFNAAQYVP